GDSAYFNGFPWRVSTHIYVWNGNYYALQNTQYAKPEFRFQALHDADRFTLVKDINYAMMVYDLVVSDKKLQPYSRELSEHMKWLFENPLSLGVATQPPADPTEYPRLAAYAYYRIILLH